jgi:hypothetical protein
MKIKRPIRQLFFFLRKSIGNLGRAHTRIAAGGLAQKKINNLKNKKFRI